MGLWWGQTGLQPTLPGGLPYFVPGLDFAQRLFDGFRTFMKKYEADLAQQRYRFGKTRRQMDLNLVFRDCKDCGPPVVDTLLDRLEVEVEEVRSEEVSLVLVRPV